MRVHIGIVSMLEVLLAAAVLLWGSLIWTNSTWIYAVLPLALGILLIVDAVRRRLTPRSSNGDRPRPR